MRITTLFISLLFVVMQACGQTTAKEESESYPTTFPEVITQGKKYNKLSEKEAYVIDKKGTEYAYSGKFNDFKGKGTFICKKCNNPLFTSESKFDSRSGWPSFDDMIGENVKVVLDADGRREEILCANCDGHLGHVFRNEGFTKKQTRHCVNSLSLSFIKKEL